MVSRDRDVPKADRPGQLQEFLAGASSIIGAADFTIPGGSATACLLVVPDSGVLDDAFAALHDAGTVAFHDQWRSSASWLGMADDAHKLVRLDIVAHAPVRDLARLVADADAVRPALELIAAGAPAFIVRQQSVGSNSTPGQLLSSSLPAFEGGSEALSRLLAA